MNVKMRARERINFLIERDGAKCTFPGCTLRISNRNPLTTDHIIPMSKDGTDTPDNWALMCRAHNSEKADRLWIDDGVLEPKPVKHKEPKVKKKDPCSKCNEGRALQRDQICIACGSEPQPKAFPRFLQKPPKDCDHDNFFCWACNLGFVERKSALETLLMGP